MFVRPKFLKEMSSSGNILYGDKYHFLSFRFQTMAESPAALQVRYLQTLNGIAAEHNNTIVLPLPVDIITRLLGVTPKQPAAHMAPLECQVEAERGTTTRVYTERDHML